MAQIDDGTSFRVTVREDITFEQVSDPRSISDKGFPSHLLRKMRVGSYCFLPLENLTAETMSARLRSAAARMGHKIKVRRGTVDEAPDYGVDFPSAELGLHVWRVS
jgi:hypothetical protein